MKNRFLHGLVLSAPLFLLPLINNTESQESNTETHEVSSFGTFNLSVAPLILGGDQAFSAFGWSVASAGDVNGDGYSDIIVGARDYSTGTGAIYIYHGSATGINTTPAVKIVSPTVGAHFGYSVSTAGDVNKDGYSDIIVGAISYSNGQSGEGAAYIYHGSPTGINTTPARIIQSNIVDAGMGTSVSCAGDVNRDGYSDVIIGARGYTNGQANEGAIYIYHGSATGIGATASLLIQSNQAEARLGISVAGTGDVNGDGYSDVIGGAMGYDNGETDEGVAFVYHGSATGINPVAVSMLESNQSAADFGRSVSTAGDINGDGYSDVIVGASTYDNGQTDEGAAFIYHGSAAGISTTASAMIERNIAFLLLGEAVACAGDINGDGYSDVIAGVDYFQNVQASEGAILVYHGSAGGVITTAAYTKESNLEFASMGLSVASAGDVNGDGYSDIIGGAPLYESGPVSNSGAVFAYYGASDGLNVSPLSDISYTITPAIGSDGIKVSSGDVNGDGYNELIVGVLSFSNGQTGEGRVYVYPGTAAGVDMGSPLILERNVAIALMGTVSAGDLNGDGYSDVVIGASNYNNGQAGEGAVYVHYGSATGISTTPSVTMESNQVNAYYGRSISAKTDVNGDGYNDLAVGASNYNGGQSLEGAVFIYYGSATGINTVASLILESNVASAQLGFSVCGAGDINGDGYGDIAAGAFQYANGQATEGAAYIYYGSATGLNPAATILESNQANTSAGYSIDCAGDVNGDGYSDLIVGAPHASSARGMALVYHGSASGIGTTPTILPHTVASACLGWSVASAGDVNGDGYSDVIVGAPNLNNVQSLEGAFYIYYGSATGLNTTPRYSFESNTNNLQLCSSVGSAGDINGDGFSDIIVGAANSTRMMVFDGNGTGVKRRNNIRLYNPDLTTGVNHSSVIQPLFGAGLFARSFIGRDSVALAWETRINYQPFSGSPIMNSVLYTGRQSAYTSTGLTGVELKHLIAKMPGNSYTKIRARVRYKLTTALTGQVYGPWRYVPDQVQGASLGVLPVDLISFDAQWLERGRSAELTFTTENESNLCCYDIEKSADGVSFAKIGRVQANNVTGLQSYRFADNSATAVKQYYRLKMLNADLSVTYSNIQLLQTNGTSEIIVFPVPADDVLQLQLNKTYGKMNIQILNVSGQVVKQLVDQTTANQIIKIPVSELRPGTYWLQLGNGNEKQVLQFVKQ